MRVLSTRRNMKVSLVIFLVAVVVVNCTSALTTLGGGWKAKMSRPARWNNHSAWVSKQVDLWRNKEISYANLNRIPSTAMGGL